MKLKDHSLSYRCYAIILAGGKGERFWPMSTSKKPKQLLQLFGNQPMIKMAVERLKGIVPLQNIFIITNADLINETSKVLPGFPAEQIIGEPIGRDTAPAITLGTALIEKRDKDAVFCVLTADHLIGDLEKFQECLKSCMELASLQDYLITIGIKPSEPSTGFGYIKIAQKPLTSLRKTQFYSVKCFTEKPALKLAKQYVASKKFFWNSGMFIWSVQSFKKAIKQNAPYLLTLMEAVGKCRDGERSLQELLKKIYPKLEKISIDYALMERAKNIVMAKAMFSWDDVGSWVALHKHFPKDKHNNIVLGHSELLDAHSNIIISDEKLVALIGVSDLVVVQHQGVTLVCQKKYAQDVKKMVAKLKECKNCHKLI